jgi:threonine dehydrogenase-like Zn-dependent dehydrogenase
VKALVATAVKQLQFEERPVPQPGVGEALVRTRTVALCGSDIHLYEGTHPYRTYPNIFGHETSGWAVEVGEGVTHLAPGDHVVVEPPYYCGACYPCSIGRTNCCSRMKTIGVTVPGALAEQYVVPARALHQAPADMSPRAAALCEPCAVGLHANQRGGVRAGEHVVVIGAGPIGLMALAGARRRGAHVAITDLIDRRLDIARRMGADLTINSARQDPVDAVRDWTNGIMAPVVIEAVGTPRTIESTIQLVSDAGRVVIAGVTEQHASIRGVDMTKKELTIYGSRNSLGLFGEAIAYVASNPDLFTAMITREYPFERAIEAFEVALTQPEQVCKVLINFEA